MPLATTHKETRPAQARRGTPPLENGDHLSRAEFERRWDAMPELKKAELIQGVVYMPAALRDEFHGEPHALMMTLLGMYTLNTPGVRTSDNASVRLDDDNMPQPDCCLRLPTELGSTTRRDAEGYLQGAPDLIVEVASSSASLDLHQKFALYRQHGVREYIIWRVLDEAVDWFRLQGAEYVPLTRDADGYFRSQLFPGLWLNPDVLLHGFPTAIFAMGMAGYGSPEHAAFVARLAALAQNKPPAT